MLVVLRRSNLTIRAVWDKNSVMGALEITPKLKITTEGKYFGIFLIDRELHSSLSTYSRNR